MEQNVVVGIFEVESEAYQAMTQLRQYEGDKKSFLLQAILVKKENGTLKVLDSFDTGIDTLNDTAIGGVVGSLIGILGGPVGVLLMGSYGALVGSLVDTGDALDDASLIEQIAGKLYDNEVAIIALANEEDETILDSKLNQFKVSIMRYDAAVVETEVEKAEDMAVEMSRQAREQLRKEIKEDGKEKIEEKKAKIVADWKNFIENANDD